MTDSLYEVLGRIKLHKKMISKYIYFFYLRKISRLRGKSFSTKLGQSNIWHKKCLLLTQYYKIYLLIGILFLSKKKNILFLDHILCDQKLLKTIFREEKKPKSIMLTIGTMSTLIIQIMRLLWPLVSGKIHLKEARLDFKITLHCKNSFGINSNYLSI